MRCSGRDIGVVNYPNVEFAHVKSGSCEVIEGNFLVTKDMHRLSVTGLQVFTKSVKCAMSTDHTGASSRSSSLFVP